MEKIRQGQWVMWKGDIDRAHRARNGKIVGIHVDGLLVPVLPSGENIEVSVDGAIIILRVAVNQPSLEPLLDVHDMPPGRVIHPGWKPRP